MREIKSPAISSFALLKELFDTLNRRKDLKNRGIHFITTWTDCRTDKNHDILAPGKKAIQKDTGHLCRYSQSRSPPACMDSSDYLQAAVNKQQRRAIRRFYAKGHSGAAGNKTIALLHSYGKLLFSPDLSNPAAMPLLKQGKAVAGNRERVFDNVQVLKDMPVNVPNKVADIETRIFFQTHAGVARAKPMRHKAKLCKFFGLKKLNLSSLGQTKHLDLYIAQMRRL